MERRQLASSLKKTDIAKGKSTDQPEFSERNPRGGGEIYQRRNHEAAYCHPFRRQKSSPLNSRIKRTERDKKADHDLSLSKIQNRYAGRDRKSTRLNSSHLGISYAVFCLK